MTGAEVRLPLQRDETAGKRTVCPGWLQVCWLDVWSGPSVRISTSLVDVFAVRAEYSEQKLDSPLCF